MAWDVKGQHRTLVIRKIAKGKLRLDQFFIVRTNDGVNYMEPIPSDTIGLRSIEFDDVQLVEGTVPKNTTDNAGILNLTRTDSNGLSARTA